jgi:hypothetical protein
MRQSSIQSHGVKDITSSAREMHGTIIGGARAPQARPSSSWYIPQFYTRQLLSKSWTIIVGAKRLILHRRRSEEDSEERFNSTSFGDLRDVHVKIEVDVQSRSEA